MIATRTWLENRVLPWSAVTSDAGPDAPTIAYAGPAHGIVKIHQMLEKRREALGAVTTSRVQGRADRETLLRGDVLPDADLVAVAGSAAQIARLPRDSALTLPFRLHILASTEDGGDGWRRRMSKSERRCALAFQRTGAWALEVAGDAASLDWFYHRMHVPTMRSRHGARARSESLDYARECLFRKGMLAFVTRDGERVAGMLCRWEPGTGILSVRLVGVLDGLAELYEDGAMRVSDHLILEWASANGVRQVDFGGCEPFLSLGTLQWKRKVGPMGELAPNHLGSLRVWWHARRDTPAVRDFLAANPVVEMTAGGGLRAVYFQDDRRPARLDLAATREGIDGHRVVELDEYFAGVMAPAR
ncbi:GNAT family N-acetyltransferase [Amycolatopsis xylanica]|uniref:GNAT family N-acetyltransferase n=1 Tax=Amycolatopsis xylanica TaxID=589385 RepID=UPI0015A31E60|nr:GNAT family N-acetyltransferase [Amycolatopsis xylanica]